MGNLVPRDSSGFLVVIEVVLVRMAKVLGHWVNNVMPPIATVGWCGYER